MTTKTDFENFLFDILNPLRALYLPGCAGLIHHGHAAWYDDAAARCESFSRPLWGLVPFFAGGGHDAEFERIYLNGIASGTNPNSDEYFGNPGERDQRFVEMAAFAYAMLLCPDVLFEPLTDSAKDSLCAWLSQINEHEVCDSNWIFFRILVNIALKKHNRQYSTERLRRDLARIDEFYIGGGWYKDGEKGQKDYYISFAFHFYGLIYSIFENDDYSRKFRERAEIFAKDFIYWFADDGEALPYGRSLTYRFAEVAFWSACVLADVRPFPMGVIKGIIARNLEQWRHSDMFDYAHLLTVGYKYQNLHMAEHYNAYGSPYWALKALAFLALPENHEFFTVEPLPLPSLDKVKSLPYADMVTARYSGSVTAYPAGTNKDFACGQIIPKYLKFAYSTVFGFSVPRSNVSLGEFAPDSSLCFELNNVILGRDGSDGFEISDNTITTHWSAFGDIHVTTKIIPTAQGHKRVHIVISPYDCTAYDCGFAVANRDTDSCECECGGGTSAARNSFSSCHVVSTGGGTGIIISAAPNTNIMYNKSVIPAAKYQIKAGKTIIETEIIQED